MNNDISRQQADIANFFSVIKAKRESFADFMKLYEPSLAPRFNLFDFIGPDENKLSEIIAFFLNPKETHGQGYKFLRIFLEAIKRSEENGQKNEYLQIFLGALKKTLNSSTTVKCTLEKATDMIEASQRRIDIELQVGNFGLAIENKPWAGDLKGQISDYNKQLEKSYGKNHYLLIYLSGRGESPSEESITEEEREALIISGHLKIITYREYIRCVNQFKTHCQSERVRCFLQDFEDYLKERFEGGLDMCEKDMIKKYVLSNKENLEIYLVVSQYREEIKLKLLAMLKESLEKKYTNELELEWEITDYWGKYQGFGFKKNKWNNYWIYFQFQGAEANGLIFGVSKMPKKSVPDNQSINEKLKEELKELGIGKSDAEWPWYQNFEALCYDWRYSYEPWVEIITGEMTDKIINKVKLIEPTLDQIENA
jgi:hypothetical protein